MGEIWVVSATGEVWVVAGAVGGAWVVVVARGMGWEATVAEEGVVVVVTVEGWRGGVRQKPWPVQDRQDVILWE